jgi:hypothetical protein
MLRRDRAKGRGRGVEGRGQGGGMGFGNRGLGRGAKPGSGPSGQCVCPSCGHRIPHEIGDRCMDINCPKCGTKMTRE